MTIAGDIINRKLPEFGAYLRQGDSLDDIDEYGFTPLIECVITRQINTAERLLQYTVDVNKADVTGRSPLHWAVDNNDLDFTRLLLNHGADPNAYTSYGMPVLVYPVLRGYDELKQLLYHHGAKLDFAQDFIHTKLLGHRFELKGDVDIINSKGEFIEVEYEGFILEFTVAVARDSLRRFISSYSTRHLKQHFPYIHTIMDAFADAEKLLQLQHHPSLKPEHLQTIGQLIQAPLLILPVASRGHALCFVKFQNWWAKIDRGENSLKEGSVNIYKITRPEAFNVSFMQQLLYKKQSRRYFHQLINQQLGLQAVKQLPISSQITGNCSWANVQAVFPAAYDLQELEANADDYKPETSIFLSDTWIEWDKDRALDECIQRFYLASTERKASITALLGGILFQSCKYTNTQHVERAEKILKILMLPDYYYVLKSYLDEYCIKRLTPKGNNLLKLLDDCGINPNIGVNPIATNL